MIHVFLRSAHLTFSVLIIFSCFSISSQILSLYFSFIFIFAGHSPIWNYPNYEASNGYKNADCKNLLDQIDHKVAFIDEFVPRDKKIILIGHSIGAYIILKMLENKELEERVCRSVLLFPTIERISSTPNGKFWQPVSYYFRHPFSPLTWLLSYTPFWIKKMLVAWRTTWKGRETDPNLVNAFLNVVNYTLMNNALIMAASEMQHVNELDEKMVATIERNIGKITFYYAVKDGWAPPHFYVSMKERFPNGDIRQCKNGFEHDFVVDCSAEVAQCVWGMISHLKDD